MAKVIARIRLAKGETGYYDEKSNIFLSWSHPAADVVEGTDCSGLRTSLRCRRIELVDGSLGKPKTFKHILMEAKAKRLGVPVEHIIHDGKKRPVYVEEIKAEAPAAVEEKPVAEEVPAEAEPAKAEEPAVKEAAEAAEEAPVEQKPKKTTRRRRTTKAKAEDK